MFTNNHSPKSKGDWWSQLGLSYPGETVTGQHKDRVAGAVQAVLRAHTPVGFSSSASAALITAEELSALIVQVAADAERECEAERLRDAEARRVAGWARVEDALAMQDADAVIADGRWAGFTRGSAFAWCWTLFQYEPHGFVHPGSQVRHESLRDLERGQLPEVFGYPERAKELTARGLNPRQYRLHREALGAATFDPSGIRH